MKKPELLSPVGNIESLYAAIEAGCDAVYLGGKHFGARNYSDNFTNEELIDAINYAHLYGVKVYVTINTLVYEEETKAFIEYVDFLHQNNVDAVIVQDIGMMDYLRKVYPNLEIHASTQMHIHNLEGAKLIEKLGLKRAVLARETDIDLIKKIKENTNIELEIFIHGALCISYSGQCLMSSLIGGRSGNRGTCAQSCRMKYDLIHENKKINTDEYLLSTKDLNTINNIDKLIDIGVDSLKIEGRMKRPEYVYLVTKLYRKAIDSYIEKGTIEIDKKEIEELKKIFNRKYTKGFLFKEENNNFINQYRPNHMGIQIGKLINIKNKKITIKLNDELNLNDGIRIINEKEDYGLTVTKMLKNNKLVTKAFKDDIIEIFVDKELNIGDKVVLTTDKNQIDNLSKIIKHKTRKVKISGKFEAKINKQMAFSITDGKNNIMITSEYKPEKSITQPTTILKVQEQLKKLGNTIYEFDRLEIDMDDNIFINIKEINEIRRKCIELLNEKRIYKIPYKKQEYKIELNDYQDEPGYNFYIKSKDDLMFIKESTKQIITDNIDLYNSIILDDRVLLKLPRVITEFQEYNIPLMVGELGSVNKYKDIVTDFSLNVTNSYSVAFLNSLGVKRVTLSLELNEYQIKKIIEKYKERYKMKPNLELIVSSYPEAMISKFNLIKYYNIPNKDNYLKDKFNNKFKIIIKDNLMYIKHYKKVEIENHKQLFELGINRLRIEMDDE